jgi:hypothetical protein
MASLALVASVVASFAGSVVGIPVMEIYSGYARRVFLFGLLALPVVAVPFLVTGLVRRTPDRFADGKKLLRERFGSIDRAAGTLGPILLMPVLMGAFGTLKQIMPYIAPFIWDDTLSQWELLIFFGYHPWQLTHAVFGSPIATMIINHIYGLWVALLAVAVLGFSLLAPPYVRARFFVSYAGAWLLLGVIGAYLFSSAGPCYAHLVGASATAEFAPLLARLHDIDAAGYPITAVRFQDMLWSAHAQHRYGFALGISAMPSMHNSIALLYALSARRAAMPLRIATFAFAAIILIGSVHLGWHYLVDGLFAWAGTAAIWWGAGVYLRWCGYAPTEGKEMGNAAAPVGKVGEPVAA